MTVTRRTTLQALGAIGAGTALTGTVLATGEYRDDERETPERDPPVDEEPAAGAAIRVAHFSPDAPNVDVSVDGERALSDLAYDEVSPYLEIAPGTYSVRVTAAGDPETVAFEGDVSFGQAFYTVAAIGELETETFRPLVLVDAGASLLRVVHGSPDTPAVDIYAAGGEVPLFSDLAFGEESNYLPLPAGSYALEIRPVGEGPTPASEEAPADGANEVEDDADDYDEDDTDEPAALEEDEPEEAADVVATLEVDLGAGTAYSASAIGYLEPGDREDRALAVSVATDGPMAPEEPGEEKPAEEAPAEEKAPVDDEPNEDDADDGETRC